MRLVVLVLLGSACAGKPSKPTTAEGTPPFATFLTPSTRALPCDAPPKPGSGGIHGIVTARGTKEPVDGVPVVAKGASLVGERTVTSAANTGCFYLADLPPGTYTVSMSAGDGSSSQTTIEVRADATSQVDAAVDEARLAHDDVLAPRTIEEGAEVSKPPE
ncbi:MAG: carboxypeptidase-like regulatory domain-containing protein [Proteobacteria bacterium]|nr:carboxypeptidase-like regulatory domain-containing protein [Pseudomonadota bacterium]